MAFNIADGFNVNAGVPIDGRTVFANLIARDAVDPVVLYEGLTCYVESETAEYMWNGLAWIPKGDLSAYATEAYADDTALIKALIFG